MELMVNCIDKVYFDYFMKMHKKELAGLPEEICNMIFKMSKTYFENIHEFYKNVISNCHCDWIYGIPEMDDLTPRFIMKELQKYIFSERPAIIYETSNFITYENLPNTSIKTIQNMIYLYDVYYQKYKEIENQMCKDNFVHIFELEEKHTKSLDILSGDELANYYAYKYFNNMCFSNYKYFLNRKDKIYCTSIIPKSTPITLLYVAETYNKRENIIRNSMIDDGKIYFVLSFYECSKKISEWMNGIVKIPSPNELGIILMTESEIEEYYAQFESDGNEWTTHYYSDNDSSYE